MPNLSPTMEKVSFIVNLSLFRETSESGKPKSDKSLAQVMLFAVSRLIRPLSTLKSRKRVILLRFYIQLEVRMSHLVKFWPSWLRMRRILQHLKIGKVMTLLQPKLPLQPQQQLLQHQLQLHQLHQFRLHQPLNRPEEEFLQAHLLKTWPTPAELTSLDFRALDQMVELSRQTLKMH